VVCGVSATCELWNKEKEREFIIIIIYYLLFIIINNIIIIISKEHLQFLPYKVHKASYKEVRLCHKLFIYQTFISIICI